MKGFFATLLVVCGLLAAAWYTYDPYLKPLFDQLSGNVSMSDQDRIVSETKSTAATAPQSTPSAPSGAPTQSTTIQAPSATTAAPAPATPQTPAPKSELELALEAAYPMPEILPLLTIVDQWRRVPSNAYPAEVYAKETVAFQLIVDGRPVGSSNVSPGTPLKPVQLVGDQLTIASLANASMSTQIAVDKTDFKERIEARYQQFVNSRREEVEAKRARARQIIAENPDRLAALTGKTPVGAAPVDDGGDPRIAPVKESLRQGEVASVKLEEALRYEWNGTEKVGGPYAGTYETVTVHFEVSTIFGKFPTEFKALLRNGKVHAWIDPVTEDRL